MLNCNPHCQACHYKALDYPTQLEKKQHWARHCLGRWAPHLALIIPAPENERLGYRAKTWMKSAIQNSTCLDPSTVKLSFGMQRSVRQDGRWKKEFISWDDCPLHTPAIQKMVKTLRLALGGCDSAFIENSLVGLWFGSPNLVIIAKTPEVGAYAALNWSAILQPSFDRVWFHCNAQVGKKIFGHLPIHPLHGPAGEPAHPIRAFRQVAQSLLHRARAQAIQALLEVQPDWVLDLYCGTGELSLLLPPKVGWMGIEQTAAAIQYAKTLRDPHQALHAGFEGAVEQRLNDPQCLKVIQGHWALYLNPPRSGLSPQAKERLFAILRQKPPAKVVYLSCSASSLARDLEAFEQAGYEIEILQPLDFFPQTEHFETLAVLKRKTLSLKMC